MPRLRTLKDVAVGLLRAFMSRNNDLNGYWGLGVLRADHPGDAGVTRILLVDRCASPATPSTDLVLDRYSQHLRATLEKRGFASADVTAAEILIVFNVAVPFAPGGVMSYGDGFCCTVTLTDRLGKTYVATGMGRCTRHDPGRESRSNRG